MSFQTTVNSKLAVGVAGDLAYAGPVRAQPFLLDSDSAAYNIIGATACTKTTEGKAKAGGTGTFAGILSNSKVYASYGTSAGGPLAATMTLPNGVNAEMITMGSIFATLATTAAIGDVVLYNTTTGTLSAVNPVASFTASQSTTVLTVTAITAGTIGVGSIVKTGALLSVVQSFGSGAGGVGTYNVSTSQTVASTTMTANTVPTPTSGLAFVPNAVVDRFTVSDAGLAVITLTN